MKELQIGMEAFEDFKMKSESLKIDIPQIYHRGLYDYAVHVVFFIYYNAFSLGYPIFWTSIQARYSEKSNLPYLSLISPFLIFSLPVPETSFTD